MSISPTRPTVVAYNGYDAGLGNRVRVVLGCQSLAELEGRDFRFVWATGPKFGPRFSELWKVEDRLVSRTTSRLLARVFPYVDENVPSWLDDRKRRERVWQIRTGSPIVLPPGARPWQDALRDLDVVDPIADAITGFRQRHLGMEPYVGVMVRSHAVQHRITRDTSPASWFIERMQQLREADPSVRFFLSCDVPEVQAAIMALVPGCVAQTDKGPYNSAPAVRASIADLYLLAGAGYLLGPHFSSFIHLAEHLAGDRLTLETPVAERRTDPVDWRTHGVAPDPLRPAVRTGT